MQRNQSSASFLSPDRIRQMLLDYADRSISVEDIELKFGISSSRLYEELEKAGLPKRVAVASFRDRLDDEVIAKIVEAYRARVPVERIAAEFGLNYDQVHVLVRELQLPRRSSDRRVGGDPAFRARLASLYADEQFSVHEVASKLEVSVKTLERMVTRFGLERRGRGGGQRGTPKAIALRLVEFAERRAKGETIAALAAEAGIGQSTLREKLRKLREASLTSPDEPSKL